MNSRPQVGVGAYILKNGQMLLGYRSSSHAGGTWSAPGGHIEFGESPAEAASRETFEECDLKIPASSWHLRAVTNDFFASNETHYITLALVATVTTGEPIVKEPHKLQEWRWFELNALPSPLMVPFVNALKAGLNFTDELDAPVVSN